MVKEQEGCIVTAWGVPSPCMVVGLAPQPLIMKVAGGPPASLIARVTGCVTAATEDPATIASTICEPDSPMLSVNPRDAPLCAEDTTLYSLELAIHDGT